MINRPGDPDILPTLEETRRFWDGAFLRSRREVPSGVGGRLSGVIEFLRTRGAECVLDAGCGFGNWSLGLAREGFQVTATDISAEAVRIVVERSRQEGLSIAAEVLAVQELQLLERRIDAIVCNSVLDHMPPEDASLAIWNFSRVVRPNGIVYLSFDGPEEPSAEEEQQITVKRDGTWLYVAGERKGMMWRYYTDKEIRRLCREMEMLEFSVGQQGQRRVWLRSVECAVRGDGP